MTLADFFAEKAFLGFPIKVENLLLILLDAAFALIPWIRDFQPRFRVFFTWFPKNFIIQYFERLSSARWLEIFVRFHDLIKDEKHCPEKLERRPGGEGGNQCFEIWKIVFLTFFPFKSDYRNDDSNKKGTLMGRKL